MTKKRITIPQLQAEYEQQTRNRKPFDREMKL